MPFINLHSNTEKYIPTKKFLEILRNQAANSLSCEGSRLKEGDFSIIPFPYNSLNQLSADMEIRITAHNFQERIDRSNQIGKEIKDAILKEFPHLEIKVFIFLCTIGMAE